MMIRGKVIKTEKGYAEIEFVRSSACGHNCGSCSACDVKSLAISAKNTIGAEAGDFVEVRLPDKSVAGIAFLVYLLPLILVFGLAAGAYALFRSTPAAIAAGAAGLILWIAGIGIVNRKVDSSGEYNGQIISVLSKDNHETEEGNSESET